MTSQTSFRAALLSPDLPAPDGLVDGQGRPAGRRFSVYRNNVTVALGDAPLASFPVVARIVGEQNFKSLAAHFLRQSPPKSPLMAEYGDDFPCFLKDFPPLSHLGYLADVARLECLQRQAYHAADAQPVPAETLGNIPPDALAGTAFKLAPSMQLLSSPWPVFDIWRFNTEADAPKPKPEPQDIAVFRPDFDPYPVLLPPGGYSFLSALQTGATLGEALESTQADVDLTALLGMLIGHGAITDIHIKLHRKVL